MAGVCDPGANLDQCVASKIVFELLDPDTGAPLHEERVIAVRQAAVVNVAAALTMTYSAPGDHLDSGATSLPTGDTYAPCSSRHPSSKHVLPNGNSAIPG